MQSSTRDRLKEAERAFFEIRGRSTCDQDALPAAERWVEVARSPEVAAGELRRALVALSESLNYKLFDEKAALLEEALELAEAEADSVSPEEWRRILMPLVWLYRSRSLHKEQLRYAQEYVARIEASTSDPVLRLQARKLLITELYDSDEFERALQAVDEELPRTRRVFDSASSDQERKALQVGVQSLLLMRVDALAALGRYADEVRAREMLLENDVEGHRSWSLPHLAVARVLARDREGGVEALRQALQEFDERGSQPGSRMHHLYRRRETALLRDLLAASCDAK